MTEDEMIAASIAEIAHRLATCAICQAAREQRRKVWRALRPFLDGCAAAGDEDNACPSCIAAEDRYGAACMSEVFIIGAHPHGAVTRESLGGVPS